MVTTIDATHETAEPPMALVKLPVTVDCANIRLVMDSLASALAGHPSVLVVDGSGTEFCDCAGISALVCAERWATSIGTRLRVVVASQLVHRVIELTSADEVLDVYATMDDLLAEMTGDGVTLSSGLSPLADETEGGPYGRHRQPDC
jgi:anti-anti-sigma factor